MTLTIETFSNIKGGNSFYKAISHPLVARKASRLIKQLSATDAVAVFDPYGLFSGFAEFHDTSSLPLVERYVQDIEQIGETLVGCTAQPVTSLSESRSNILLIATFDSGRLADQIRHLIPDSMEAISFDTLRLDDALLTNTQSYLERLNFATNFAFFRDLDGMHTRLVTTNYWAGYGAKSVSLHLILFDENGAELAEWDALLPDGAASIQIDSREIRERFDLGPFTGQLFIHAVGIAGHDVVKYALDVWNDNGAELSCTHDANAWPAEYYAGLPAPCAGEDIVLWIQNSHPCAIPAGNVGLNLMGDAAIAWLNETVPPYGTYQLRVSELLPEAKWPQQLEVQAGKHFVRPRYEIADRDKRRRIAHVNVERVDLKPDPAIAEMTQLMGKGYILPAPILPLDRWRNYVMPTPMATCQHNLPIMALIIDGSGQEVMRHQFGCLSRNHSDAVDLASLLNGKTLPSGHGHLELVYDFSLLNSLDGGIADGWLHGLFRYEDQHSGHGAETSFGAHIFNTVLTYRDEPQSYVARPPGLSTRLFLRLGGEPFDTLCHLIYPASTPWHARSKTKLYLNDSAGDRVAERDLAIPCGGSHLLIYSETFSPQERASAGREAYVVIRDTTCRLFGYHGLIGSNGAFSLDHMFGF